MSGTIVCRHITGSIPFLKPIFKTQALMALGCEFAAAPLQSFIVFIAGGIKKLIERNQKQLDNKQQAYHNSSKLNNNIMLEVLRTR